MVPVSPNTFYAYLQVIVLGLRASDRADAQEIQSRLGRLRGDLDKFRDAFDVVGQHLTNARNKYDEAASGLDRLEGKLEGSSARATSPRCPGSAPETPFRAAESSRPCGSMRANFFTRGPHG